MAHPETRAANCTPSAYYGSAKGGWRGQNGFRFMFVISPPPCALINVKLALQTFRSGGYFCRNCVLETFTVRTKIGYSTPAAVFMVLRTRRNRRHTTGALAPAAYCCRLNWRRRWLGIFLTQSAARRYEPRSAGSSACALGRNLHHQRCCSGAASVLYNMARQIRG